MPIVPRSTTICDVEEADALLWITLDRTALLARTPVTAVRGKTADVTRTTKFANGTLDASGKPGPDRDIYAGACFGTETDVAPIAHYTPRKVFFKRAVPKRLREQLLKAPASLWQYGVSDSVEIAAVRD